MNKEIIEAWGNRQNAVVFTTVDNNKMPNSIYVTCVALSDSFTIVVADNYFDKTKQNSTNNSVASVLFITEDGASYQIKGTIIYHTAGDVFDFMKSWNPQKHPGKGAVEIIPTEMYSGARKLL
ncbi:MAG: pyridoxamine 5'-phosphate oxidase family protein [Bacteroidales bacterium]|jgi:predicted pyridoxine 5'-phosphate oxidase superfamily flavin-nucleotide-binding protein|nr:pyridoxamine 5'-phosphate oxidase family protein [Bacteroidales bacterium]